MKTSVEPTAMIPTADHWSRMFMKFCCFRNTSLANASVTKRAMNANTIP